MLIIVPRIDKRLVRQGEDLVVDRPVESGRISILEIGPAASVDEQSIAGKHSRCSRPVEIVAMMIVSMSRRVEWVHTAAADHDRFALAHRQVDVIRAALLRDGRLGAGHLPKPSGARY